MRYRGDIVAWAAPCVALIFMLPQVFAPDAIAQSQSLGTATPVRAQLRTATPEGFGQVAPTVTVEPSQTPPGPALLEARETAGRVNVRALPDPDSEIVGTIVFGTQYPALRRYYLWLELRYEPAPLGRAWVFGELVDVIGDADAIETIEDYAEVAVAPVDAPVAVAGAEEDSALEPRTLVIETRPAEAASGDAQRLTPLPTFTYPPDSSAMNRRGSGIVAAGETSSAGDGGQQLPPLLPIGLLAGLGLAGLLLSGLRQL